MPHDARTAADVHPPQQEVARVCALPEVQAALDWIRTSEPRFVQWQMELARIPAPPFGEAARSRWLAERFHQLSLDAIETDDVGNVFAVHPGAGDKFISLSAHLDTVFPSTTTLNIQQEDTRLLGPGVSDNAAGVTAMLAIAAAMRATAIHPSLPILFVGNVGEEGEGDLRGMRHIFSQPRWLDSIVASIILDGAGADTVVAEALGSRRFEIVVRGPGGHSWTDFGLPNPIVVLSHAVAALAATPVPATPKTTLNVGVIRGGTSVNSIPETASMRVDIRSTSPAEIDRLEKALRVAVDQAVDDEQRRAISAQKRLPQLAAEVVTIGNRPAGELASNAHILQVIRAVDAYLDNPAQVQRASTDANIPLSLGREAIALGAGGRGGGAHTFQEWFDCSSRDLGLKRILLTILLLAGVSE
jgi:acetylornithine deacetylase/succinyl-diaminopimelate desuccinylase-like protein